eukprot:TRINITY_DN66674_c2_g1_i1.p1 TRINITY_DN66674_c2_g1~~TRINITY_DN66674_c2_g1_i1.p1  ORF type:complete len:324 (+),score=158.70 TRINITY_DN66674_c2_g1_i1:87-1058(+)
MSYNNKVLVGNWWEDRKLPAEARPPQPSAVSSSSAKSVRAKESDVGADRISRVAKPNTAPRVLPGYDCVSNDYTSSMQETYKFIRQGKKTPQQQQQQQQEQQRQDENRQGNVKKQQSGSVTVPKPPKRVRMVSHKTVKKHVQQRALDVSKASRSESPLSSDTQYPTDPKDLKMTSTIRSDYDWKHKTRHKRGAPHSTKRGNPGAGISQEEYELSLHVHGLKTTDPPGQGEKAKNQNPNKRKDANNDGHWMPGYQRKQRVANAQVKQYQQQKKADEQGEHLICGSKSLNQRQHQHAKNMRDTLKKNAYFPRKVVKSDPNDPYWG